MDTFRASEAKFGSEVDQELFWLEGFSDGQDADNAPESAQSEISSNPLGNERPQSRAGMYCKLVSAKIRIVLFGLVSMWTGYFFAFLGDVPRAFGWQEAANFAISWGGSFTISFMAFFALLFTTLSVIPPLPQLPRLACHRDSMCGELSSGLSMWGTLFLASFLFGMGIDLENHACLQGILVAVSQLFFVKFFDWTQRNFHTPYIGGFLEALKGLGCCLGLLQVRPTNVFDASTLWATVVIAVWGVAELLLVISDQDDYIALAKWDRSPPILVQDTYWYAIVTRVIMNRSFWSLTCYCVFCSGPFLSVSYWWCSAYLMDIYGLDDSSNNETVAFLWIGVIVGSIVFPHLFFVLRPTKWIPFSMSVVALVSSLCISVIPCWRMRREYFVTLLFVLGMTAGSCKSVVYPLYLDRFRAVDTVFALSLTTYLTVLSGFVYHLISYWPLSCYVSRAKSVSTVERLNVYQLSVWLLCVICFGLASFAILWVSEPASKPRETVEEPSMESE